MATNLIGFGETYTTIQGWENGNSASPTEPWIGELKNEEFPENVLFNGVATSSANYIELRPAAGLEHRGISSLKRFADGLDPTPLIVGQSSGHVIQISDQHVRLTDIEVYMNGSVAGAFHGVLVQSTGGFTGDEIYINRVIVSSAYGNTNSDSRGIFINAPATGTRSVIVYRCFVYGTGGAGIYMTGNDGIIASANTVMACCGGTTGVSIDLAQVLALQAGGNYYNNISLLPQTGKACFTFGGLNRDKNASGDFTGDTGFQSLTASDHLTDTILPSSGNPDLRLLETSTLRDAGDDLGSFYETGIQLNTVDDGGWDIGADEWFEEVAVVAPVLRRFLRRGLRHPAVRGRYPL